MHSQLLRIKTANVISPKQFPRKTLKPSIHYLNVTRGQGQKSYFRGRIIKESFISFPGLCLTICNERTSLSVSAAGQAQVKNRRKAADHADLILRPDSDVLWNGAGHTVDVSFLFSTEAGYYYLESQGPTLEDKTLG